MTNDILNLTIIYINIFIILNININVICHKKHRERMIINEGKELPSLRKPFLLTKGFTILFHGHKNG